MPKIYFIIGTRPELIKVAPLLIECKKMGFRDYTLVNTAQHKDLLAPYWKIFGLQPDITLDFMKPGQSLSSLTMRAMGQLQEMIDGRAQERPDIILAQGDTTTVMAASITAFYNGIKFAHLEAGLRSYNLQHPFPEEFNRRVAGITAWMNFAPTEQAKDNLLKEGIRPESIKVVGNTVVDALQYVRNHYPLNEQPFEYEPLNWRRGSRFVLVTCHRRENHGANLVQIIEAVATLAREYEALQFVWAIHPNPNVKNAVLNSKLGSLENITLTPPLSYFDLLKIMADSQIILTDSGGIQEEAPSFGVPVLVMRETTERPEGVAAGISFLVGAAKDKIIAQFRASANGTGARDFTNPYGDGLAASEVMRHLTAAALTS